MYLIRHAQAGLIDNYDMLSENGREQARLLGRHFAAQGVMFGAVYAGRLHRQRLTAEIVCEEMARRGPSVPEITFDERWDEFNLASVYEELAPRLLRDSADFARDLREAEEEMRCDPRTTRGAKGRCDAAVILAWMEHRYPDYTGETWEAFRTRIHAGVAAPPAPQNGQVTAVFTSATPIAVLVGAALGLTPDKLLSVLGVIYNSSVTVMRARGGDLRLFTFNATPHLDDATRTFR